MPKRDSVKEGRLIFASWSQKFQCIGTWLYCFWASCKAENIMVRSTRQKQTAHLTATRKQREMWGYQRDGIDFQNTSLVTCFLQLDPHTYPPFPIAIIVSILQGINPLIRSETSGSSHFQKPISLLVTKLLKQWTFRVTSHPNYTLLLSTYLTVSP